MTKLNIRSCSYASMIGNKHVRRTIGIVVDFMQHCLAAADMIWNVLRIGRASDAGRKVHAGKFETNPMALSEQVGGCHDLDVVLEDFTRHDGLPGGTRQVVPGLPRL